MEEQIVKQVTQTASRQSDALFLARLEVDGQRRFVRRLMAGLTVFLLLWLTGLWYFKQPSLIRWWQSAVPVQSGIPLASDSGAETAQVEQLSRELAHLQEQLGKAVTETLSVKLAALEDRIRMGRAGLQDLELIQSMREDIGLLTVRGGQRSSFVDQSMVAVTPLSQSGAMPTPDVAMLERLGRLETLVYLSFGAFALVIVAVGGYFFRYTVQLKRLETDLSRLSGQLPSRRHSI